jgi:hypothetical protein
MAYGLSFSEAFFTGDTDVYYMKPSESPTNVFQAILSLPKKERLGIARDVLKSPHPVMACMSDSFEFNVLDKIRETDLCDDLRSPITVYIDPDQNYSVTVYEEGRCTTCNELLDQDCQGELRCPDCDGPCLCCSDGDGPI